MVGWVPTLCRGLVLWILVSPLGTVSDGDGAARILSRAGVLEGRGMDQARLGISELGQQRDFTMTESLHLVLLPTNKLNKRQNKPKQKCCYKLKSNQTRKFFL